MIPIAKLQSQVRFKKLLHLQWIMLSSLACFFSSTSKANDKLDQIRNLTLRPATQQLLVQKAIIRSHDTLVQEHTGNAVANNSFRGREASRKMAQYLLKGLWLNYKDQAYAFISHDNEYDDMTDDMPELNAQINLHQNQLNYRLRVSKNRLMFKVQFDF